MDKNITICIPTYEMKGKGKEYLKHSLDIIAEQTYTDFDVVVSDHSTYFYQEQMQALCKNYPFVTYYKNENNRGSISANTNYAMSKATGKYVKILFQDDFLFNKDSLQNTVDGIKHNTKWLVSACEHFDTKFYRPFYPEYNDNIHLGNNTISSPSVLTVLRSKALEFDEELNNLMDVDYYKRMFIKYGNPTILNKITVVNRTHEDQQSNLISQEDKDKELEIIKKKYGK